MFLGFLLNLQRRIFLCKVNLVNYRHLISASKFIYSYKSITKSIGVGLSCTFIIRFTSDLKY